MSRLPTRNIGAALAANCRHSRLKSLLRIPVSDVGLHKRSVAGTQIFLQIGKNNSPRKTQRTRIRQNTIKRFSIFCVLCVLCFSRTNNIFNIRVYLRSSVDYIFYLRPLCLSAFALRFLTSPHFSPGSREQAQDSCT